MIKQISGINAQGRKHWKFEIQFWILKQNVHTVVTIKRTYYMKIINIDKEVTKDHLLNLLQQKLNPLFQKQRQSDVAFSIENAGNFVEISQPDLYEGFLFRIEIKGNELWITRSEHYVDDVNSLTIESILYLLFEELAGNRGVIFVLEG